MLAIPILFVLLTICIVSDFKSRRIPNSIICVGLISGFLLSVLNLNSDVSALQSLLGILLGLLMFLPIYLLGKMGAGDVKLLAMCGSFLGLQPTLIAGLCTLLAGGLFALIWTLLTKITSIQDKRYPYAAAIAVGTAMAPYVRLN